LWPDGWAIICNDAEVLKKVQETVMSLHWAIRLMHIKKGEELLAPQKKFWWPDAST
jgi:hypothetical protein